MNKTQLRIVRYLGTGAVIGAAISLLLPKAGIGKAELVIMFSILGMMGGATAGWFTGLK